ncbi:MBL fold metallo-hydrolase [Xanthobacter autotrophicus]|uniref:MBL fold metallo-hydrolase n=1 Tax=Xanthobacter autotrophicus TaxID=280 RepID=UPI003728481D
MTEVSRRTLLAGTAGVTGAMLAGAGTLAGGLVAGSGMAHAQSTAQPPAASPAANAPQAGQVPSAYRYKVGDVVVTAVSDGMRTIPLTDTFVRNQPREAVNAALKTAFLPENEIPISFTVLLLDMGGRRVLVDTGNGGKPGPVGQVRGTLADIGIDPATVDHVVISHFHQDHINGLLTPDGAPAFPKAQVSVPEREWAFWMDEGQMSRAPEGLKNTFQNVRRVFKPFEGKVERYAWDKEVAPGLTAVGTPGHTPGHTSFSLDSGFDTLFIQSDITNLPALFVRNPTWHAVFDMDPVMAQEVRRKTYERLAAERTQVAGYHFPFPGAAHLEKDGEGFRYIPIYWRPVL